MKLFNTRTNSVEQVNPLSNDCIRMYSCGPTVYDHAHIGNLASFVVADVLRRVLADEYDKVIHVMNFTDVDDKTIRRAQNEHPQESPKQGLKKVTRLYEEKFLEDMKAIGNNIDVVQFVRATDSIEAMQDLIKRLYQANIAYIADDGVYFSIEKYRAAGKTYGQLVSITAESTGRQRVANDEYDKDNIHDFALWKKQEAGEPSWEFSLDGHDLTGRPGWHIECSAMSESALGLPFDIHTGGIDLKFPHHENEIAQSTGASDQEIYASSFVHNEHLLVDGKKMSKSLGNFYRLVDLTDKKFDPLSFRLLVLQSHYQSRTNFTWEGLKAAQNRLHNLKNVSELRWQTVEKPAHRPLNEQAHSLLAKLIDDLRNNLDTPQALSTIGKFSDLFTVPRGIHHDEKETFVRFMENVESLLGVNLLDSTPDLSKAQYEMIEKRNLAREQKDFNTADSLRNKLKEQGIVLEDAPAKTFWQRTY